MLTWLSNLRLSLTQWLLLLLASTCGALVFLLRLQGSRLHQAQIDALEAGIKYRNVAEDENIEKLRTKMEEEIQSYENARS